MKQRHTIIFFLPCLNFYETWNNKIQQLHDEGNINKFHRGFKIGGGGGWGGSKLSDTIITFYHPTKLRCQT